MWVAACMAVSDGCKVASLYCTGSSQRKGAKFGEGSSVRADWLCSGCPKLVGRRKMAGSNRGHFVCTSL